MDKRIIKYERTRDYQRKHVTGVIVDGNIHGEFYIEFFEDIEQLPEKLIVVDDDVELVNFEEAVVRTVHTGLTLHVNRIPEIIHRLQEKLNQYLEHHSHDEE